MPAVPPADTSPTSGPPPDGGGGRMAPATAPAWWSAAGSTRGSCDTAWRPEGTRIGSPLPPAATSPAEAAGESPAATASAVSPAAVGAAASYVTHEKNQITKLTQKRLSSIFIWGVDLFPKR